MIGVCAPAGAVEREAVERGASTLRALGFEVRFAEGLFERHAFTAGRVERRVAELHALFDDDAVAGIVCARGGAGAAWLLPRLDPGRLRRRPKVFVGYSDVTFLHLYMHRLGLATFHGPMVGRELADGMHEPHSFWAAITGAAPLSFSGLRVLRGGRAEGRLRGGCLAILAAAAGTPWAFRPDPEGTILFLEDIDERPYRVDRMLYQLRAAGAFDGVEGVVFGEMKGCGAGPADGYTLEDVIRESLDGLDVPIAFGLASGHTTTPAVTLPLGVRARLEGGEEARLEILEAGVSS